MNWEKTVYQGEGVYSTLFSLGLGCALGRAVTLIVVALIGGVGTVQHQSQQLRVIERIQTSLPLAFSGRTFARNQHRMPSASRLQMLVSASGGTELKLGT